MACSSTEEHPTFNRADVGSSPTGPTDDTAMPWPFFLGGKWVRKRPTAPGLYPVASANGEIVEPRKWRRVDDQGREMGLGRDDKPWAGWWWDRPCPPIVRPPCT